MPGKAYKITAAVIGALFLLLLAAGLSVQLPGIQTALARKLVGKLESGIDAKLSIGGIRVLPSGVMQIKDLVIIDTEPAFDPMPERGHQPVDTFFRAGTITATFTLKGLISQEGVHLGRVTLDDAMIHITDEPQLGRGSNIKAIFNTKGPKEVPVETGDIFDIRKIKASDVECFLTLYRKKKNNWDEDGIHVGNLHAMAQMLEGHGVKFTKGRLHATLDKMRWKERCGLDIDEMSGRCVVGMGQTLVEDFHIKDRTSEVNINKFTMDYPNTLAFREFMTKVSMNLDLGRSTMSAETFSILAGLHQDSGISVDIESCKAHGQVCDLAVDQLRFTETTSGIPVSMKASAKGLPKIGNMLMRADIDGTRFTTGQLSSLLRRIMGGKAPDLSNIAPGQQFVVNCRASGPLDKFEYDGKINSPIGSVSAKGLVYYLLDKNLPLEMDAGITVDNLDVSKFTGKDLVGQVSGSANGHAVFVPGSPAVSLDGLQIDGMEFNGYNFSGISAQGTLADWRFRGNVRSTDPNMNLKLRGYADLKPINDRQGLNLDIKVDNADLAALNLDKGGGVSKVSSVLRANIRNFSGGMYDGRILMEDIVLENESGPHHLGDVILTATEEGGTQAITLNSAFADADFYGYGPVSGLPADIQELTTRREIPAIYKGGSPSGETTDYSMAVEMHDSRELMAFLKPNLYIADGSSLRMNVKGGELDGYIESPRLALGKKFIRNAIAEIDNRDGKLSANILGSEFNAGLVTFDSPTISASADSNRVRLKLVYDGLSGSKDDCALDIDGLLSRNSGDSLILSLKPLDSFISIGGERWSLEASDISLGGGVSDIDHFSLSNGIQRISLDGGISRNREDRLSAAIENLDLSLIDKVLGREFGISGTAGGKAIIESPTANGNGILMNFGCDSLSVGDFPVGSFKAASVWDEADRKLGLSIRNTLDGRNTLVGRGSIFTDRKKISADVEMDGFSIAAASPFLSGIFSSVSGGISGKLAIGGSMDAIEILSNRIDLDDILLKVAYTGVPYSVKGPMALTKEGIRLDNISIIDGNNGKGTLSGIVRHSHYKDFGLDTSFDFTDLLLLDRHNGDDGIYGHIAASGNASLKGSPATLNIDANVRTAGEGNLHVGMSGALTGGGSSNLLTFTEQETAPDPYEEMMHSMGVGKKAASDLTARAKVTVTPGTRTYVEIDKSAGNIISFNGSGSINLEARPAKDIFNLNGDYSINEGNYHFVIPGILEKDFEIQRGSAVNFGGDIMDSNLSINAIHNLKTSLSTLITDSTAVATRRLVECGIDISGKLRNPQIGFNIDVPDLDPTTRSLVQSALNTEDKVQKQFVSLLLIGSFLPSEHSGVFNGTNMLYSNMSEIFSNQLNSILQKLEIPLDLGVGYEGMQGGTNIFDVAISTQLFNNRVVVNGSVGNRKYTTSTNPNGDMVGDLDIQVKLDQPGKVRLNLFSHSADEYTSYLDYSQRNGMGLSYQKEFNTIGEFFRSIFMSREKRERHAAAKAGKDSGKVIIKIDNEQRQAVSDTLAVGR